MTNPPHNKLSSQFGDITGPSDAELADIESGKSSATEAGAFFTPEVVEGYRRDFAHLDPNYAALRRSREGTRGTGATDFGAGTRNVQEHLSNEENFGVGEGPKGSGNRSDFDAADMHRSYRGTGAGGWDVEAGKRASSFEVNAPRSADESRARAQGLMFLKMAGPTCNHPYCQGIRAKGMELLGRGLGSSRALSEENWHIAEPERAPFPSVRKDVPVPTSRVKDNPKDPTHPVMSYGTGESTDTGDFEMDYKNTTMRPKYTLVHTKDPEYKQMLTEYTAGVRHGNAPLFHPDDYMEHHHYPGEETAPLPWEK